MTIDRTQIPRRVRDRLKSSHPFADISFVICILFVVFITDKLIFYTLEAVGSRTDVVLVAALKHGHETNYKGSFSIHVVSLGG